MRALIERLNTRFAGAASGQNVLVTLVAVLLVFSLFNNWLVPVFRAATNGLYPIDMVMPTTAAVIYANYAAYTAESIRIYHWFLVVDFFWPPLLALLFALAWSWLAKRCVSSLPRRMITAGLLLLPFAEALLDLLENLGFFVLLANYPVRLPAMVWATAGVRYAKLVLYVMCWLVTLMFLWLAVRGARTSARGGAGGGSGDQRASSTTTLRG